MTDFATMSNDDKNSLIKKLATCLTENNLDAPISTSIENVGILMAG